MSTIDAPSHGVLDINTQEPDYWYVMRDLKRANAKLPAYMMLGDIYFYRGNFVIAPRCVF